jgi:hypothetical protein
MPNRVPHQRSSWAVNACLPLLLQALRWRTAIRALRREYPEWGVTDPTAALLGYIVGTATCLTSHTYERNGDGYTFTWWIPACSTPESDGNRVNVTTSGIPNLANMAALKTH